MTRLTTALAQQVRSLHVAGVAPGTAGRRFETWLPMNRCITVGDYLVSANGLFFAVLCSNGVLRICRGADVQHSAGSLWSTERPGPGTRFFALVQSDGNFCIYRGDDLMHNEGWQWGTQITADGAAFYAILRDDGMLAICKGSGPDQHLGDIWTSGATDPIRRIDSIIRLDYDLDAARLIQTRPSDLYRETVRNDGPRAHSSLINGSVTVSDTYGWSDALGHGIEAPEDFRTRVPMMADGRIALSAEAGHVYCRNSAATSAKSWGFHAPAAVPARSSMMCLVTAQRSSIAVPYSLSGVFTLASGAQVTGTVSGTYHGSNCHDLSVTLSSGEPAPADGYTLTRPLAPESSVAGPSVPHSANGPVY